jgi:hypothetical protein
MFVRFWNQIDDTVANNTIYDVRLEVDVGDFGLDEFDICDRLRGVESGSGEHVLNKG